MKQFTSTLKRAVTQPGESGQAIVLIALFMIVMLAMVGVAIDGGGLFLLWRDAQNAADSAAIQAAYDRCTSPTSEDNNRYGTNTPDDLSSGFLAEADSYWGKKGLDAADDNGFDWNDANITVTVDEGSDDSDFTEVTIKAEKPAYFIQLVYRGPLTVEVTSVVYCKRAFDWGDIPGAIGMGDCACPPSGTPNAESQDIGSDQDNPDQETVDIQGGNAGTSILDGGIHSNCNAGVNGSGLEYQNGDPQATQEVNGNNTGDNPEPGAEAVTEDPVGLDVEQFMPGGDIWDYIAADTGQVYWVDADGGGLDAEYDGAGNDNGNTYFAGTHGTGEGFPTDPNPIPSGEAWEGLLFVDGNVDLNGVTNAQWLGSNRVQDDSLPDQNQWRGLTVVATGQIVSPNPDNIVWYYYGHLGDNVSPPSYGVTWTDQGFFYPSIVAFSSYNSYRTAPPCTNVGNDAKGAIITEGNDSDTEIDYFGVFYAPYGAITFSGNQQGFEGAMVGMALNLSVSNFYWIFNPSMVPTRPPTMSNVE